MKREDWIWMPHAGHFVCGSSGSRCNFRLATYVGGYIVSTVGELQLENGGGYEEVGRGRKYETVVFRAKKTDGSCGCQYHQLDGNDVDFVGYNDPVSANRGHYRMCEKWGNIGE